MRELKFKSGEILNNRKKKNKNMNDRIKRNIESNASRFIKKNINNFCFRLGNFLIPKRIITNKKHKIDIEGNRNKLLISGNSPFAVNMENYLKDKGIRFIKEFIIIIQDFDLWKIILDSFADIDQITRKKYEEMNYFSLDYFLPDSLTCIEIDSNYHNNKKTLDLARDIYLKNIYSIETIRFFHFGENKEQDNINLKLLNFRLQKPNINFTGIFNYEDIVIRDYLYENEPMFIMLERLIKFIGLNYFFSRSYITTYYITGFDYRQLAFDINFGAGLDPLLFYQDFVDLMENITRKELIIFKNIVSYSIKDIVMILNNEISINNIIEKFNKIPYWISKLIKIPDEYSYLISEETGEDIFVLDYIKKLTSEKRLNSY